MKNKIYTSVVLMCLTFNVSIAANKVSVELNFLDELKEDCNSKYLLTHIEEIEEKKRPCTVYVKIINSDGSEATIPGRGGDLSWDDCGKYKDQFVRDLVNGNVKFTEDDVTVIWG